MKSHLLIAGVICLGSLLPSLQANGAAAEVRLPPPAQMLPVGKANVFSFDEGEGVDRQPTLAPLPSGGFLLVYARYGDMDSSVLRVLTSRDGSTISSAETLAFGGEIEDAPSFVTTREGTWLYFASGDSNLGNVKLWRSRLVGRSFSAPDRLADVPGLRRLTQWPRWVDAGPDVLLTFRGEKSVPHWLRLKDGMTQHAPIPLASFGVAYPRVVPTADHGCFFSYQRPPEGGYMATYFRVSPDCSKWSPPTALSWPEPPGKPDVHDAYALPRLDAGVDIYYVYPSRKGPGARFQVGFDLYRRAVMADGSLGAEERLTVRDELNPRLLRIASPMGRSWCRSRISMQMEPTASHPPAWHCSSWHAMPLRRSNRASSAASFASLGAGRVILPAASTPAAGTSRADSGSSAAAARYPW